jgi:GR25 family glycosyltransferase involved in LPS biosynthesis
MLPGIDNVYIINLEKDKERLRKCAKECKKIGIIPTRIGGIHGKQNIPKNMLKYISTLNSHILAGGLVGCGLSHIKTWETIVANGDSSALILEDDAVVDDNFLNLYNAIFPTVPQDYYMIYLGCYIGCNIDKKYSMDYTLINLVNAYTKKVKKINNHVYTPAIPLAFHGYILSNKGARYLLECFEKDKLFKHIDYQALKYIKDIPVYAIDPQLIRQKHMDISTSNNIKAEYPVILNYITNIKVKGDDIPLNYKLSVSHFEIYGIQINLYALITFLSGITYGLFSSNTLPFTKFFILFNIIEAEFVTKDTFIFFIKHAAFMYLLFILGIYSGNYVSS